MQLVKSCKGGGTLTEHDSNAKSGDDGFLHLIKEVLFIGTVHSIFERTINVECLGSGELYTIASCKVDNAPNTLVTDLERCSSLGLAERDRVFAVNRSLRVGNKLTVSIEQAEPWQSVLPAYPADDKRLRSNLQAAKAYIEAHGQMGGMKQAATFGNSFEAETARLLEERSSFLLRELSNGNWSGAADFAIGLIGLGPGLTPSGDDYLTGLFTVFNLPGSPLGAHRSFCEKVAAASSGLTNPISCITMKKAATGQVRESIIGFLQSAIEGGVQQMIVSLTAVLSIGSSSGTDIALGLIDGLELNLEQSWR